MKIAFSLLAVRNHSQLSLQFQHIFVQYYTKERNRHSPIAGANETKIIVREQRSSEFL